MEFDELCDFLSGKMADYKIPSLLEVVDVFPSVSNPSFFIYTIRQFRYEFHHYCSVFGG